MTFRATATPDPDTPKPAEDLPISARWRRLLSVVIGLHVLAVFIAPFTFATSANPGMTRPSPIASGLMACLQPYVDALFLQHGYAFFAPDPGPSHLYRIKLEFDDGRPVEELTFPDAKRHWPRLLYHRHFMLSERLIDGYMPPVAPPEMSDDPLRLVAWRRSREEYESYFHTLKSAYEHHARTRHGASKASLVRVRHRLPDVDEVLEKHMRLNDPEFISDNPEDVRVEVLP